MNVEAKNASRTSTALLVSALLAGLTVFLFWPVVQNGFVQYDDPLYVTENPFVLRGLTVEGVRWAFSTTHASNWHPLTWLSHMVDAELFGRSPRGHHLSSQCIVL